MFPQGTVQPTTAGLNQEAQANKTPQVKSLLTDAKEAKPTPSTSMQLYKAKIKPATRQEPRPESKKADQVKKTAPRTAGDLRKHENKENLNVTNSELSKKGRSGTTTTTASVVTLSQTSEESIPPEKNVKSSKQVQIQEKQRGRKKASNPWARDFSKPKEDMNRSNSRPNLRYSIAEEEAKVKFQDENDLDEELGGGGSVKDKESPSKEDSSFCQFESQVKGNRRLTNVSEDKSQAYNPMNSIRRFGEEFHDLMDDFEDIEEKLNSENALSSSASFIKSANQGAITMKKSRAIADEKYSVSDLLDQKTQVLHKGRNLRDSRPFDEEKEDDDILEDSLQEFHNPKTPLERKKSKIEQQVIDTVSRIQPYSPPFSRISQTVEQVMNTRGKIARPLIVESHDTDDEGQVDSDEVPEPTRKLDMEKTVQEKLHFADQKEEVGGS